MGRNKKQEEGEDEQSTEIRRKEIKRIKANKGKGRVEREGNKKNKGKRRNKEKCICRDSNPDLHLGRVEFCP